MAKVYKNKSVAEQNSVDLAWTLLMTDEYSELRTTIAETDAEVERFRQLVVNTVLATDIMDKDLKSLRNARVSLRLLQRICCWRQSLTCSSRDFPQWDKAFLESPPEEAETAKDAVDRKATIVIEHLIQASDVSHTMQHWHVYRKWNERLFRELSQAYREGRAETDPADNWYKGEIGFLDFYVIPLAKKLKDCGVFGVSSDEYLAWAQKNRKDWEEKGQEVVAKMVENFKKEQHESQNVGRILI